MLFYFCGCSRPESQEFFIKATDVRDICGPYIFDVDLTDSISKYDISLYLRIDCSDREFDDIPQYNAKVKIISSDADTLTDSHLFCKKDFRRTDAFSRFYSGNFKTGFKNEGKEYKKVTVEFDTIPPVGTFRGVGLKSNRTK